MINLKKNILSLVFLLLFLIPCDVFAATETQKHIYFIEEFNVTDSRITIDGYSYISHRDNYGYDGSTGKGNLKTYIVIYKGNWNAQYTDYTSCNNSDSCYSKQMTASANNDSSDGNSNRDFYFSRCVGVGCTSRRQDALNRANGGNFDDGSVCVNIPGTCSGDICASNCLYTNVGFRGTIDLVNVFKKFGTNTEIRFRIVSTIVNKDGSVAKTLDSPLAVYKNVCTVNSSSLNGNGIVNSGDFSFKIGGLGDTVIYDATTAMVKNVAGESISPLDGVGYFKPEERFKILDISTEKKVLVKKIGNGVVGRYTETLIRLDSILSNSKTYKGYNAVIPDFNGFSHDATKASPGDFYTNSNFVKFDGEIELKIEDFKEKTIKLSCNDIEEFKNIKTDNNINCGESNIYSQCVKKENISSSGSYLYILHNEQNSSCTGGNYSNYKEEIDGKYYLKIKVSADVLLNQGARFSFGKPSSSTVYAGKGFGLGDTIYRNTIIWMNATKTLSGKPYYTYSYNNYISNNNACISNTDVDINNIGKYFIKNDAGKLIEYWNLSDASFAVIDKSVRSYIKIDNIDNISFTSCDSNNSSKCNVENPNYDVLGNWKRNDNESKVENFMYSGGIFGKKITNDYKYNLSNSYVFVSGDNAGKVLYIENVENQISYAIQTGNKFYIDFKWIYGADWPFNLSKNINPSIIDDMKWTLNGTCSIKVKDSYYKNTSGVDGFEFNFRYRSISLENPFPKFKNNYDKIAINWREWYKDIGNKNRIRNTYSNNPLYSIVINKYAGNGGVSISDINSITRHYGSKEGIDKAGMSEFVNDKFNVIGNTKSYCPLGKFIANECDIIKGGV